MRSWAKWTAKAVLVTTGFAAAGGGFAGVAHAGTGGTNTGSVSVLGGNQVSAPVSIPIDVCGNAVALLGIATAGCQGGAEVLAHPGHAGRAGRPSHALHAGNLSAGSGNQVQIPVKIAANACGNAIGNAKAACDGGVNLPGGLAGGGGSIKHAGLSAGNVSVGDGNQVRAPVTVPADICGNAAAVLGSSNAGCEGGATVGGAPLPASALSAFTGSSVDSRGMSGNSFVALAIGALLAGAAALKLAGRRSRARKSGVVEVPA